MKNLTLAVVQSFALCSFCLSLSPEYSGKKGIALTTLRPSGTAEINGKRVDVVTESSYVEQGKKIKVIAAEGMRVVVKEIN